MKFTFKNKPIQTKYNLLELNYKPTYLVYCRNHYRDDRRVFINIYRQLIRFLLVADITHNKSCYMDCAIAEYYNKVMQELEEIKTRFENLYN